MAFPAISYSRIALLVFALLRGVTAIPKAEVVADRNVEDPQDVLSLATPEHSLWNESSCEIFEYDHSTLSPLFSRKRFAAINLFKRGCELPQGGTCPDGAPCCINPTDSTNGWCCGPGRLCWDGIDGAYCGYTTIFETSTTTSIQYSTAWNTFTESEAGTTVWQTETSTSIVTLTESNVDTATQIQTVTVTRQVAKRAEITPLPTSTLEAREGQRVQQPRITQAPQACETTTHKVLPRQDVTEVTETSWVTEFSTASTSADTTVTDTYTDTSTTTYVSTITFTSAVNAKTTITSIFTLTVDAAQTAPPPASNGGDGTATAPAQGTTGAGAVGAGGGSGNDGGLSTGAKAGIGAGVGAAALIALLLLGFFIYRRRKNRQMDAAVAAAASTSNNTPAPMSPEPKQKSPVSTMTSPGGPDRYSGMIPVPAAYNNHNSYSGNSPHSSTPAPAYQYGGEQELYGGARSPAPVHSFPAGTPGPYEVGHGVPSEMAGWRSPDMGYAQPVQGYGGQQYQYGNEQRGYGHDAPELYHPRPQ